LSVRAFVNLHDFVRLRARHQTNYRERAGHPHNLIVAGYACVFLDRTSVYSPVMH